MKILLLHYQHLLTSSLYEKTENRKVYDFQAKKQNLNREIEALFPLS